MRAVFSHEDGGKAYECQRCGSRAVTAQRPPYCVCCGLTSIESDEAEARGEFVAAVAPMIVEHQGRAIVLNPNVDHHLPRVA